MQSVNTLRNGLKGAAPLVIHPVAVVNLFRAVNADADLNVVSGKDLRPGEVDQGSVGLNMTRCV